MNKKTLALTEEQYYLIIDTIKSGFTTKDNIEVQPNPRVATALVLEANLGLRIGDIVKLRISSIIKDGSRYRLNIVEEKTGKSRDFTVPDVIYNYILDYAVENKISKQAKLFDMTERAIQKQLKLTCDYLGFEGIGTHSFRKFFATKLYTKNGYNMELVRDVLQHANTNITQRYIGLRRKEVEDALENNVDLR